MAKIKALNEDWAGRSINLPFGAGVTEFDKDGVAKVESEEIAEQLAEEESLNIEVVGKKKSSGSGEKTKSVSQMNKTELIAEVVKMERDYEDMSDKSKDELKAIIGMSNEEFAEAHGGSEDNEDEEDEETEETMSKEEKIDYINSLDKMDDLKELAVGFPEDEWKGIKSKAQMKEYLLGKIEGEEE